MRHTRCITTGNNWENIRLDTMPHYVNSKRCYIHGAGKIMGIISMEMLSNKLLKLKFQIDFFLLFKCFAS